MNPPNSFVSAARTVFMAAVVSVACSSTKATTTDNRRPAKPAPSEISVILEKVNALLGKSPATEKACGTKQSRLLTKGLDLVLESSWSRCPGTDRSSAPIAALDPDNFETELASESGHSRIFVSCRSCFPCSPRLTRTDGETQWRQLRVEKLLTVDAAPDDAVMKQLASELKALLLAHARAEQASEVSDR